MKIHRYCWKNGDITIFKQDDSSLWVKWEDVEALVKDAERYRWLRCGGWEVLQDPKYWTPELRFDGVIDAAMAKDDT